MNQSCSAISLFLPTWLAASEPLLTVLLWEASAIQGIRSGVRGKGGGAGMRDRERDREENTKLADTGHNLISTVGGQLCSVICHGSPFRLQWPTWPAKENSYCSEPLFREGGGDWASIYGLVLKKHTLVTCYWKSLSPQTHTKANGFMVAILSQKATWIFQKQNLWLYSCKQARSASQWPIYHI